MGVMVEDKNAFILDASKVALHALLSKSKGVNDSDPKGLAESARKYAVALWLAMRAEVK